MEAKSSESRIRKGQYLGPLDGIPIAVKDIFETAGMRTTAGSKILADNVPAADATSVKKLRDCGAVIIGKANLHEWALGVTSNNPHFGTVRNPWDIERVPGGSSGGSAAALAAGMCLGALGTDTGGSIRIPSAACGIVGLKPTRGLVSLRGVMPLSWSLDHAGPMALTVEDCAVMLDAISGYDPDDPESAAQPTEVSYRASVHQPVEGLRIALPTNYFFESIDEDVERAVHSAVKVFEKLGASVSEVSYPDVQEDVKAAGIILLAEAATIHQHDIEQRSSEIGSDVMQRLKKGQEVSVFDFVRAKRTQATQCSLRERFFEKFDIMVTPTLPMEPPLILGTDAVKTAKELTRFTSPFNLAGLPAISIPCGFSRSGVPIGLQLVAAHWNEAALLSAAYAYQESTSWRKAKPQPILAN